MGTTNKSIALVIVALFLTSLATIPFSVSAHAVPAWNIQTISTRALNDIGIALDSNNNPHIAYTEWIPPTNSDYVSRNGRDDVIYASWNGSMWINQTVAEGAAFLDFVLDSNDKPHILYKTQSTSEGLVYASWIGYNWNRQTVDEDGLESSLALDSAGNPHIAYFTNGNTSSAFFLKYTSWTGSSWSTQIVDDGALTYLPFLKLDAQDHPHIMYETLTVTSTNSSEELKYAAFDNASGWTIQTVGQNILGWRNMVLDTNGYPHYPYKTSYLSWTGSAWNNQSFMSKFNSSVYFGDSYLAMDKQNYPHIALDISSEDTSALTYIRWTGAEWVTQTVDSNGRPEAGPITIDSNGGSHICYLKNGSGGGLVLYNLMYASTTESTQIGSLISAQTIAIIAVAVLVVAIASLLLFRRHRKTANLNQ